MSANERALEASLFQLYSKWWRECGYRAERFRQMIVPTCKRYRGGIAAARSVLTKTSTGGFSALVKCNRLDLTVEQLVLGERWQHLFTESDRELARRKLEQAKKA